MCSRHDSHDWSLKIFIVFLMDAQPKLNKTYVHTVIDLIQKSDVPSI